MWDELQLLLFVAGSPDTFIGVWGLHHLVRPTSISGGAWKEMVVSLASPVFVGPVPCNT